VTEIRRLNWGCGDVRPPGWINSDIKSGPGIDISADIARDPRRHLLRGAWGLHLALAPTRIPAVEDRLPLFPPLSAIGASTVLGSGCTRHYAGGGRGYASAETRSPALASSTARASRPPASAAKSVATTRARR
jgi:hypothetical protein